MTRTRKNRWFHTGGLPFLICTSSVSTRPPHQCNQRTQALCFVDGFRGENDIVPTPGMFHVERTPRAREKAEGHTVYFQGRAKRSDQGFRDWQFSGRRNCCVDWINGCTVTV